MNNKKIIGILFSLLFLYVVVLFVIPRTIIFSYLWKMPKSEYPILYSDPIEIELNQTTDLKYPTKEFKEIKFIIPSQKVISEKLSKEGIGKTFDFGESKRMIVSEGLNPISIFNEYKNDKRFFYLKIQEVSSNLDFFKALASARVDDVSLFNSNTILVTKFVNIEIKSSVFLGKDSQRLYHFTTPNVEAFESELGDLKNKPVVVIDKKTNKDYLFIFSKNISQDEIRLVLSSINTDK